MFLLPQNATACLHRAWSALTKRNEVTSRVAVLDKETDEASDFNLQLQRVWKGGKCTCMGWGFGVRRALCPAPAGTANFLSQKR